MASRNNSSAVELSEIIVRVHDTAPSNDIDQPPPSHVSEIVELLRGHDGIDDVQYVAHDGTIVIQYDKKKHLGLFIQGLIQDKLSKNKSHRLAQRMRVAVRVVHEMRGRIRLNVTPSDGIERLAAHIAGIAGVERSRTLPASDTILVQFDPLKTSRDEILSEIAKSVPSAWPDALVAPNARRNEIIKTTFSIAVFGGALTGVLPPPIMLTAAAVTAIPPFRRAIASLKRGHVNVDVLDATAITVSLVRADVATASIITALLAVGDLILERTHARARTAISDLMQLDDGEAFVLDVGASEPRRVAPKTLVAGMRIIVYPGGRVPADGVIEEGTIAVDEKAVTGESVPRECTVGDRLMAASVAVHGQAVVRVELAGSDTVAARIVQILEGAGAKPMTLQHNAEKYADRMVIPAFVVAGLAYGLSGVVERLVSVLITDFGTGVRVAVPTTALTAMVLAARAGILVKGSQFLERMSEADTIVFDKTGTLTLGLPEVVGVVCVDARWTEADVIAFAAAAERSQTHPIATALCRYAERIGVAHLETHYSSETYHVGLGLKATVAGRSVCVGSPRMMREFGVDASATNAARDSFMKQGSSCILVAIDGAIAGAIGYADAPRPESRAVVESLRAGGRRRVLLLSGDARSPVEAMARACGIDEAFAEVLPQDKAEIVRRLKAEGRRVAMVGDGINDAPALAVADVGISLSGGTAVALETADVVLLEGGLERLPEMFKISDQALGRVRQVLGIVLAPNAIAIVAGALGFLTPVGAAVINNGSTIAAALHAVSPLLRHPKRRKR